MNPIELYWERLGRHLLPQDEHTGDKNADAARSLGRTYEHALNDYERAVTSLRRVREETDAGKRRSALKDWASSVGKYAVTTNLLSGADLLPEEHAALKDAHAEAKKIVPAMQGVRLTKFFLAVIRADQPALLLSNIKPANPAAIDAQPTTGFDNYRRLLLDAVLFKPPPCPFIVIEFDRTVVAPGQLVLNVPPESGDLNIVRTSGPLGATLSRKRLLAAIDISRDTDDKLVWQLTSWEQNRLVKGEGDFDRLDKLSESLQPGVDVDALLDVLPRPDSFEEKIFKMARQQDQKEAADIAAE